MAPGGTRGGGRGMGRGEGRGGGRGMGRGGGRGLGRRMRRGGGAGQGQGRGMGPGPGLGPGSGPGVGGGFPQQGEMAPFVNPAQPQSPAPQGTTHDDELARMKELARSMEQQKADIDHRISQVEAGDETEPPQTASPQHAAMPRRAIRKPRVDESACTGCGICLDVCPVDAIVVVDGLARISDDCTGCGACVVECPNAALALEPA